MQVLSSMVYMLFFFFQAEDGIRDYKVTGVQTCALPILPPGDCEAPDHQRIPGGQDLVVEARANARGARAEELCTRGGEQGIGIGAGQSQLPGDALHRDEAVQVPGALEIRLAVEPEAQREHAILVFREQALDLVALPHVEAALMPLGI